MTALILLIPSWRGLGGGSDLELPAEQAGVEVVSRGIRSFLLNKGSGYNIPPRNISIYPSAVIINFEF